MNKRLQNELKEFQKHEVDGVYNPIEGIYVSFDESDITKLKCMINGLKDTPYEFGNFFIEMNIPKNYPFVPPIVKFLSSDGIIRFHPFLYQSGKICLSILNTWSGPSWTSIQTIKSVLMSIQSIFNNNPLNDEPGHHLDNNILVNCYSRIVEYYKYEFSIINQLNKNYYPEFYNIQVKLFNENYNSMIQNIQNIENTIVDEIKLFGSSLETIISLRYSENKKDWVKYNLYINQPQNNLYTEILNKCDLKIINNIQEIEVSNPNKIVYIKIKSFILNSPNPFRMRCKIKYYNILKKLNYLKENLYK